MAFPTSCCGGAAPGALARDIQDPLAEEARLAEVSVSEFDESTPASEAQTTIKDATLTRVAPTPSSSLGVPGNPFAQGMASAASALAAQWQALAPATSSSAGAPGTDAPSPATPHPKATKTTAHHG